MKHVSITDINGDSHIYGEVTEILSASDTGSGFAVLFLKHGTEVEINTRHLIKIEISEYEPLDPADLLKALDA